MIFNINLEEDDIKKMVEDRFKTFDLGKPFTIEVEVAMVSYGLPKIKVILIDKPLQEAILEQVKVDKEGCLYTPGVDGECNVCGKGSSAHWRH